jgi:hypothetical protein
VSGQDDRQLTDWRGQPIVAGVRVIWHQSHPLRRWKLGRVVAVDDSGLSVEWDEQSGAPKTSGVARGVAPWNVTVWPGEAGLLPEEA